jgi:hypothetical protein
MNQGEKSDELIWTVSAIAEAINRDERATAHLLRKGLPGAQRLGGKWCLKKSVFLKSFEQVAA